MATRSKQQNEEKETEDTTMGHKQRATKSTKELKPSVSLAAVIGRDRTPVVAGVPGGGTQLSVLTDKIHLHSGCQIILKGITSKQ